jgi:transposase InsO family protein
VRRTAASSAGDSHPGSPPLKIRLIMDNGPSHASKATRAWIAARPRFAVTYTPKHPSWLNIIVQWFSVLTRKLLSRGDFTSQYGLETRITDFTIGYNRTAHPWKWKSTPTPSTPATSNAAPARTPSAKPHERSRT